MAEISIAPEPADSIAVRWCFEQYAEELGRVFGYELDRSLPLSVEDLVPPRGLVLIARVGGDAVGCGAIKLAEPGCGEIKRMWVTDRLRGHGVGGRLLEALERVAAEAGKTTTRLETNRHLATAIAMYRRHGYREVPAFNEEPFGDHWFEKDIAKA